MRVTGFFGPYWAANGFDSVVTAAFGARPCSGPGGRGHEKVSSFMILNSTPYTIVPATPTETSSTGKGT